MRHTQSRARWRRGSAAIGVLIAMALLSLVALGVVTSSGLRAFGVADARSGARAQLAAESAIQMGLRELKLNTDSDADGTIGAIGTGTALTIDGASVRVAKSFVSPYTYLTATATLGSVQKKAQAKLSGTGGTAEVFWSQSGNGRASVNAYNGSTWPSATTAPYVGADPYWVSARACPLRDEVLLATLDTTFDVNVMVRSSGTWSSATEVCTDAGTYDYRAIDVAYEQTSGDGLVCYWRNASNQIGYRTVISGTISSEGTLSLPTTFDAEWIQLVSRPSSDEILMLTLNSDADLVATFWNGSSWGTPTLLDGSATDFNKQCFAAAYQSTVGRPMVVWGRNASTQPRYSTWNGSSWSASATIASVSASVEWVRLASDPGSNKLLLSLCTGAPQPWLSSWDGTSWATPFSVSGNLMAFDGNVADVAFESTTGKGLAVYRKLAAGLETRLYYRPWTGTAWGSEVASFSVSQNPDWVKLAPQPNSDDISVAVKSTSGIFDVARWNGTTMSAKTSVSVNLAGVDMHGSFDHCLTGISGYVVATQQQIP